MLLTTFKPESKIHLIIYDLDGTLIDSRRDIVNAVNWTLSELGLKELAAKQISSFVGNGVTNLMRQALEAVEVPRTAPFLERSIKIFRKRYGEHLLDETSLYPSVRQVLEFFKDRKQAVITNKPEEFSLTILKGLGIDSYFFKVVGGDRGFPKKPDPAAVFDILSLARISPEETLLVGDSATDIQTGRNAGVRTAAVTYGFGKRPEIETARPDFLLEGLEELTRCPLLKS